MAMALMLQELNAENFGSGEADSGDVLTANGSGGASWETPSGGGATHKVYAALLSQTGDSAPIATVLENTLGGNVVWSREDVGFYKGTLANEFPVGKTIIVTPNITTSDGLSNGVIGNCSAGNNCIDVQTALLSPFTFLDDELFNSGIIVFVYP